MIEKLPILAGPGTAKLDIITSNMYQKINELISTVNRLEQLVQRGRQ